MLDRLDPRQAHQIFDQGLHTPSFMADDPQEPQPRRLVAAGFRILQRLDITKDRGQRGTQFMAGIGDKIGVGTGNADPDRQIFQRDQSQPAFKHPA